MLLGSDILTQDLDICIKLNKENLERLYAAVKELNPRYRMDPKLPTLTRELVTADSIKNLYLLTDLGVLDCLGSITGLGEFEEVDQYSKTFELEDFTVKTLYFDGLIKAKSAMGREKDKLTVLKLMAIKEKLGML